MTDRGQGKEYNKELKKGYKKETEVLPKTVVVVVGQEQFQQLLQEKRFRLTVK